MSEQAENDVAENPKAAYWKAKADNFRELYEAWRDRAEMLERALHEAREEIIKLKEA